MKKFYLLLFLLLSLLNFAPDSYAYSVSHKKNSSITYKTAKNSEKRIVFKWHQNNLKRHFHKHRSEFPEYKTMADYEKGALNFFRDPPQGTQFKRRPNGDRLFYYEKSNFFGVTTRDGTIKTFFRPNRGKNYWKRQ